MCAPKPGKLSLPGALASAADPGTSQVPGSCPSLSTPSICRPICQRWPLRVPLTGSPLPFGLSSSPGPGLSETPRATQSRFPLHPLLDLPSSASPVGDSCEEPAVPCPPPRPLCGPVLCLELSSLASALPCSSFLTRLRALLTWTS